MDLEKIRDAAERVARSQGLEIFDVEWKIGKQRAAARLSLRLPGPANPDNLGVSHADCQCVSEQLSVILDVEDLVPGPSYILELSSPGMDRKLIKPADYERFVWYWRTFGLMLIENQKYLRAIGRLRGRQCEVEMERARN